MKKKLISKLLLFLMMSSIFLTGCNDKDEDLESLPDETTTVEQTENVEYDIEAVKEQITKEEWNVFTRKFNYLRFEKKEDDGSYSTLEIDEKMEEKISDIMKAEEYYLTYTGDGYKEAGEKKNTLVVPGTIEDSRFLEVSSTDITVSNLPVNLRVLSNLDGIEGWDFKGRYKEPLDDDIIFVEDNDSYIENVQIDQLSNYTDPKILTYASFLSYVTKPTYELLGQNMSDEYIKGYGNGNSR